MKFISITDKLFNPAKVSLSLINLSMLLLNLDVLISHMSFTNVRTWSAWGMLSKALVSSKWDTSIYIGDNIGWKTSGESTSCCFHSASFSVVSQAGGLISHKRFFDKWTASQSGTSQGKPATNGPKSPTIRNSCSWFNFGTTVIKESSAKNSSSQGWSLSSSSIWSKIDCST